MGKIRQVIMGVILAAFTAAASTQAIAGPAEDYRAEIDEAQRLGRLLYEQDVALEAATQALPRAFKRKPNNPHQSLVERVGDGVYQVLFYLKDGDNYTPLYVATAKQGQLDWDWLQFADGQSMGDTQVTLIRARERALMEPKSGCSGNYEAFVVPDETIGYFVYVLAVSNDPNAVVVGGHLRHDVDPTGQNIVGFKKFTNTCLTMGAPEVPKGAQVVGLAVSQVLTKHPTEIHVMASLKHAINLYVITGKDEIWKVVDGNVYLSE